MNIIYTLLIAIVGWLIAKKLKLPAPAMLGSMIAVGITNILFDYATLPSYVRIGAQAISGAYVGLQITKKDLLNFKLLIKPFILLFLALVINTIVVGNIISYLCNIDITTALLGSVAGGVTDMSMIAIDMGADVGSVAFLQTCRLICVLLFFPYWIKFMTKDEEDASEDTRIVKDDISCHSFIDKYINTPVKKTIFTLIISLFVGYIGQVSGIPAGAMVFPIFIIAAMNCTTNTCAIPKEEKIIAQLLAGAVVGASIKQSLIDSLDKMLLPVIILVISYWVINYVFSIICKKKKWLDMKSAMFASAPGGATDMTLIAADLNADLTKIAVIQVLRAGLTISIMPNIIALYIKFFV
ncbi:AbrB family transcriptional regulator [Anaerorhabdus sp.]|uniref:AbrB family transcriptional regulator n=1 Tax=Anaerorhabdus sp. TaxID=1872524 RepID=UPI002FC647C4